MITLEELIRKEKKIRADQNFIESNKLLFEMLNFSISEKQYFNICLLIGENYFFMGEYEKACKHFLIAKEYDKNNEKVSLGVYLSFIKLGYIDEALEEMICFSEQNALSLYKDTIKELLNEIHNKNIKNKYYINKIISLAKKYALSPF